MILACHHISKEYPENVVLRDVTFHLERGDKAALIGINGAGKTTLLRIIVGQENADEGTVSFERDCSYGYLAQNQGLSSERTVYEEVLSVKQYLIDMEKKLSEYEKQMEILKGEALTVTIAEYTDLLHRFERENASVLLPGIWTRRYPLSPAGRKPVWRLVNSFCRSRTCLCSTSPQTIWI